MKSKSTNAKTPWSPRAHSEVSGLRRAITADLGEPMVNSAAAPMMGELLTRLEGFVTPRDVGDLRPPQLSEKRSPLSQGDAAAALQSACGALRDRVHSGADDPQTRRSLQAMVEVLEEHLSMKSEIVARCTSDATPG